MGDTKRGREREGKNKRHQRVRREMERAWKQMGDPWPGEASSESTED